MQHIINVSLASSQNDGEFLLQLQSAAEMQKLRSTAGQENYSSNSENADHLRTGKFGNLNEPQSYYTGTFENKAAQNTETKPKSQFQNPLQKSVDSHHSFDYNRRSFKEREDQFKKMQQRINERKLSFYSQGALWILNIQKYWNNILRFMHIYISWYFNEFL